MWLVLNEVMIAIGREIRNMVGREEWEGNFWNGVRIGNNLEIIRLLCKELFIFFFRLEGWSGI